MYAPRGLMTDAYAGGIGLMGRGDVRAWAAGRRLLHDPQELGQRVTAVDPMLDDLP